MDTVSYPQMLSSSEMSDASRDLKAFGPPTSVCVTATEAEQNLCIFSRRSKSCHEITSGSDIIQWVIAYTNPQWSGEPDLLETEATWLLVK